MGGRAQMPLVGAVVLACSLEPASTHHPERLEGIMRIGSPRSPVFGTHGAVPRIIIIGHLMLCNLIGI